MTVKMTIAAMGLLVGFSGLAAANQHAAPAKATATSAAATALTEGEVRKVDKDAKKLTLRHGPIANLDMPGMTMVFRVKDPAVLDQVKTGDKVKFTAENIDGAITVTQIVAAN